MPEDDYLPARMRERVSDPLELAPFMEWKQTEGAARHPALGVPTDFDRQRAEFVRIRPYKVLEDLLGTFRDTEFAKKPNLTDCSWDDVLDEMREAKKRYYAIGERNPLRKLLRHGSSIEGPSEALTDLIPDDYGLGVLRGGLRLIFKMIAQREENREKIFSAFERITVLWVESRELCQTLSLDKPSHELQNEIQKLYIVLLEEIPALILLLGHKNKPGTKFLGRIVASLPTQEASHIDDIIQRVTLASQSLDNCRNHLRDRVLADSYSNYRRILKEVEAVRKTLPVGLWGLEQHEKELKRQMGALERQNIEIKAALEVVKEGLKDEQKSIASSIPSRIYSPLQSGLYFIAVDNHSSDDTHLRGTVSLADKQPPGSSSSKYRGPDRGISTSSDLASPVAGLQHHTVATLAQVVSILDVPIFGLTEELRRVVSVGGTMKTQALEHGWWLATNPGFGVWLAHQTQSDLLLVDGHCSSFSEGKVSPLSVFCGSLASKLSRTPSAISLYFFCGEHLSPRDPLRGPQGVLRGIIAQLLQYPDIAEPDLEFVNEDALAQLARWDIDSMMWLLHGLVRQAGSGVTVYCIIDNISVLEGSLNDWSEDLHRLVRGFLAITWDRSLKAVFKLLITSEDKSTDVVRLLPAEKHVALLGGNLHSRPQILG